ncbi:cupin domain-containing protein [Arthrobacter sp. NPDC055138]
MDSTLIPGKPLDLDDLALEHRPVPEDQVTAGRPTTGVHRLGVFDGLDVGVWEMSAGGMHDIESGELFMVISGSATVQFHDEDDQGPAGRVAWLGPGTLLRLSAGMRTTWSVHESLRKIYFTPSALP